MRFDENEIQDLAAFFSRRFPGADQRRRMASSAGLSDAEGDWGALLQRAQVRGRLGHLADAAASQGDDDDNLREVCAILTAPRRRRQTVMVVASAVAVALMLVTGLAISTPSAQATPDVPATPAAVLASADEAPPEPLAPAAEPAAPEEDAAPTAVAPTPEAAGSDAEPEATPAASAPLTGRCRAAKGALIGYWYAGEVTPGRAGTAIEVPVTVNVRADYPDEHNRFNARAPVRCVLMEGDRLVLSRDPILVPGQRYWVPLYGGDLP